MLDLTSDVYGVDRRDGKSNRITRLFKIPTLVHLQLGLSLGSLRIHVARAYSVLFLQSRKSTDYYHHSLRGCNAYKIKGLGDDTNIGQERIEMIRNDIHNFLAKERMGIEKKLNSIDKATLSEIDTQSNATRSLQQQDTKSPSTVDDVPDAFHLTNDNCHPIPNDTGEKRKIIMKRKCSLIKQINKSYALKKMKQREKYQKIKNIKRPISKIIEGMIGDKLIELVMKQRKYYDIINGKLCLSIRTGVFIQDLISNCGCSLEKMPIIISTVLRMLFGNIDEVSMKRIVKCSKTYTTSTERTAALVKENTSNTFIIRDNESTVLNAYLIMDATNKGNKNLVAKLYNYVSGDGIVRLGALNLDNTGINCNMKICYM